MSIWDEDRTDEFNHEAESFDEWFKQNEELCSEMLRSDAYDLMYQVWLGGYTAGLSAMSDFVKPIWSDSLGLNKKVDDKNKGAVD